MNENHKRVAIFYCSNKLLFVKAIKESACKSLLEAKNIADSVMKPHYNEITGKSEYQYGKLLLNESSITPKQWEQIVQDPDLEIKWEYV